ncbi:MAG TPA: VOC family protein [Gaiellaceae bacterium]|nr:VOC family protein [Gaiellaceae bacterium]
MALSPLSLDHVALWVADRDRIAAFATGHLGMHEIERTDDFTLVGADARRFKLTLFAADGPREPGPLEHIALRVSDLAAARAALPDGLDVDENDGRVSFEVAEGLRIALVEARTPMDYDLDHVALRSGDPAQAVGAWHLLGFHPARPHGGAERIGLAGAYLELREGDPGEPERPLLNHLAVLVDSADDLRDQAVAAGAEVADVKDAPNTYAVFVLGPDGVKLEYVEHKPSFSLV